MKRWTAVACGCALVLLIAAACSSSGSKHLTSPTVVIGETATPEPSVTPRSPQARTGIPEVDTFIDALQVEPPRARRQAIEALLGYQQIACSFLASSGTDAPMCHPGEQEGAPVAAFPYKSCSSQLLRPDQIESVLILLGSATLYAVYPSAGDFAQSADYVAIVYHAVGTDRQAAAVELKGGRITGYEYSCKQAPEQFVQTLGLGNPVYLAGTP